MRTAIATVFLLASCFGSIGAAHAQLLDNLKGAAGMGNSSGSGGGLGGMSMPSVGSASNGNIAGVLGYCVRNNYVGGSGASSVQNNLMGKLSGNTASSPEFTSGENGTLQTGNGQSMNLGGGGLKAQLTQKVCDQVLKHAKSLI